MLTLLLYCLSVVSLLSLLKSSINLVLLHRQSLNCVSRRVTVTKNNQKGFMFQSICRDILSIRNEKRFVLFCNPLAILKNTVLFFSSWLLYWMRESFSTTMTSELSKFHFRLHVKQMFWKAQV